MMTLFKNVYNQEAVLNCFSVSPFVSVMLCSKEDAKGYMYTVIFPALWLIIFTINKSDT